MSKMKFELPAPLESNAAYGKIKGLLSGENDFKKFDPKVSYTFDEPSKICNVSGSQFKATLQVVPKDSSSCQIMVEVEVPFSLALFKGKIKDILEKNLNRLLT